MLRPLRYICRIIIIKIFCCWSAGRGENTIFRGAERSSCKLAVKIGFKRIGADTERVLERDFVIFIRKNIAAAIKVHRMEMKNDNREISGEATLRLCQTWRFLLQGMEFQSPRCTSNPALVEKIGSCTERWVDARGGTAERKGRILVNTGAAFETLYLFFSSFF